MTDELRKKTDELLEELKFKNTDIQEYIENNPESFIEINLKEFWAEIIDKSKMTKSDIINKSDFSYVYFYDVISGKKIPTSDKIVRLILAMHLPLEDCQTALKYCGKSQLYPRIKRDSIIIYAITHGYTVLKTQEALIKAGESELK
ncbi:MAG: hypothetical protein ACI4XC_09250 [Eubacterium sp.]